MRAVARLAVELGIAAGGYRTVINTGNHRGQTVHHLHVHLLGGNKALFGALLSRLRHQCHTVKIDWSSLRDASAT